MTYDWHNSPWTRRWKCTLCLNVYRIDLSAEDGGDKNLVSGHCEPCTRGLVTAMRAMNMLKGHPMGTTPPFLRWHWRGSGVSMIPAGEETLLDMDEKPYDHGLCVKPADAQRQLKEAKRKQSIAKKRKATKRKVEVDDFLKNAGL